MKFSSCAKALSIVIAFIAIYLGITWEHATTPFSANATLAELITISLNGQDHFVCIRTQAPILHYEQSYAYPPILLILHGGPGASDLPYIHKTDETLEEHFLVVHYDQRSAGKSCRFYQNSTTTDNSSSPSLTIQMHIDDALSLILYLRERFRQDKIYLLGGSWGSVLALLLAKQYPQYIHHVATRGLVVTTAESERQSYSYVLSQLPELRSVVPKPPPYGKDRVDDMILQRKWLTRAGGQSYQCRIQGCSRFTLQYRITKAVITSPEMSWGDVARFKRCFLSTLRTMWAEVEQYDAYTQVPQLVVPLLVLHGKYDYCTVHTLVEDYVKFVAAPQKKLVWFWKSGHSPHSEESELFQKTIVQEFLGRENANAASVV